MNEASTSLMGTYKSNSSFFTFLPYQSKVPVAKLAMTGTTPYPQNRYFSRFLLAATELNLLCFSPRNCVSGSKFCYASVCSFQSGTLTECTLPLERQYLTKACGWIYSDLSILCCVLMATTSCSSPDEYAATMRLEVAQMRRSCASSMLMLRTGALARAPQTFLFLVLSVVQNCTTWLKPVPTKTLAMLKPYSIIITGNQMNSYGQPIKSIDYQKQPERVTPPHTMIMMKQITNRMAKKRRRRIFQFSHIMACLIVRVDPTMSNDSADIVQVFFTRISIFSSRSNNFCKSSLRIWFTSSVSFHSLATLSTSSGELQSYMLPLRMEAKSMAPYIDIFFVFSAGYVLVNILRILSRYEKAILSEYLVSAMTMKTSQSQRTQKMQLLAENLPYLRLGEHRLRICWAVSTKLPLKGVNSERIIYQRATTVYIRDISLQNNQQKHQPGHSLRQSAIMAGLPMG